MFWIAKSLYWDSFKDILMHHYLLQFKLHHIVIDLSRIPIHDLNISILLIEWIWIQIKPSPQYSLLFNTHVKPYSHLHVITLIARASIEHYTRRGKRPRVSQNCLARERIAIQKFANITPKMFFYCLYIYINE